LALLRKDLICAEFGVNNVNVWSWVSEGFFPGGGHRVFFQNFSREPKWWNLFFPTHN